MQPEKKDILLWCYTKETRKKTVQKQTSSDKDEVLGRTSNYESQLKRSEEVEGLCQQLKEKHGSKYKLEQIQTWAHMFHVGTHDTLEEPPDKPFFVGWAKKDLVKHQIPLHPKESCFRIPVTRQASERL